MQISRVFSKFSQNCPSPEGTCSYLEDVARDDLQQRFSTQHTISTLLRHCFECLQHCSNIATLCCAKKSSLRIVQCNITLKGRSCVCFDICGGIERASSRGHRARMQFPQKFCPFMWWTSNCKHPRANKDKFYLYFQSFYKNALVPGKLWK